MIKNYLRMARTRVLIVFVVLLATSKVMSQTGDKDRIKGWSSDIDTLLYLMKTQHYVYKSRPLPPELVSKAAALKTEITAYSDDRMLMELEHLAYYMHDGHSYILPVSPKVHTVYLPMQFYLFSDGVYVIDADEPYKNLIGSKVLRIYGVAIEKLLDDMNSCIHQDNKFTVKWFAPSYLRFRSIYESYGLNAGSADITLELEGPNNRKFSQSVNFIPVSSFHSIPKLIPSKLAGNIPPPLYLSNVADNFWFTRLHNKTLYFQFNQVEDKESETLEAFGKRFGDTLQSMKPRLLIIDVRNNNGGNLALLHPLMDGIISFEKGNPKSKIVIITGRNTFSAAQVFISLMNKNTHALFAGEPSASSPNFVGEGNYITLPYSQAFGSISNRYHESIPGDTRKWIQPDIPVLLSSKAYFKNEDPVLKAIVGNLASHWSRQTTSILP
jgi:hypothetical protein